MTLDDRLERLAHRTPPGDPSDILAAARVRVDAGRASRRSRSWLLAAAAVVTVLVLGAGVLALTGDERDSVTVAGPEGGSELDGWWTMTATVTDGEFHVTEAKAYVSVDGDTVVGDDGCGNRMMANLVDLRAIWDRSRKHIGCDGERAADDADRFWHVIEQQPRAEVRDGELWLVAEDGDALIFHRLDGGPPDAAGGVDGPVMYAPASHSDRTEFAQLTGGLGHEDDCLRLQPPPNVRDPLAELLLWPYGTTWENDPAGVRLADGTFIPVGAQFTAAGGFHDIDRLAELGHHPEVVERARSCARGDVDVVAYVQGRVEIGRKFDERTVERQDPPGGLEDGTADSEQAIERADPGAVDGPHIGGQGESAKDLAERVLADLLDDPAVAVSATDTDRRTTVVRLETSTGAVVDVTVLADPRRNRNVLLELDSPGLSIDEGERAITVPEPGTLTVTGYDGGFTGEGEVMIDRLEVEDPGPVGPLDLVESSWLRIDLRTEDGRILYLLQLRG